MATPPRSKTPIDQLRVAPITEFGRRVLITQAMLTRDGNVGPNALARQLDIPEKTVWFILKEADSGWWHLARNKKLAAKLVEFLKVDKSWLFDEIDYGDLGNVEFKLRMREARS